MAVDITFNKYKERRKEDLNKDLLALFTAYILWIDTVIKQDKDNTGILSYDFILSQLKLIAQHCELQLSASAVSDKNALIKEIDTHVWNAAEINSRPFQVAHWLLVRVALASVVVGLLTLSVKMVSNYASTEGLFGLGIAAGVFGAWLGMELICNFFKSPSFDQVPKSFPFFESSTNSAIKSAITIGDTLQHPVEALNKNVENEISPVKNESLKAAVEKTTEAMLIYRYENNKLRNMSNTKPELRVSDLNMVPQTKNRT